MKKVIWKYELETGHNKETFLNLPVGSKILNIGRQGRSIFAWVELNAGEQKLKPTKIFCAYTGSSFDDEGWIHLKSVCYSDTYVVHFYGEKLTIEEFIKEGEFLL